MPLAAPRRKGKAPPPVSRLRASAVAPPWVVFALLASTSSAQQPAEDRGPEAAAHRYVLEATLDPSAHTVTGTARILWTNESTVAARELWLHLYLNAFESRDTVFMRESGGALRGDRFAGEGGIELTEVRLAEGADLLAQADDEVIRGDRTQMRVPLPEPVEPGASIELVTQFVSRLPPVFARTGYSGSFHMVAQWFPKLARREADGTWATFPFHGHGEFYADFATYDLTVTTPAGFTVGATGEQVDERRDGDAVTRRFLAERVHDTAFAAWEHFRERAFEAEGVRVRVLHPPGYEPAVEEHVAITRAGLARFGELFGAYPYPVLTVIVPPRQASGAAGMEYPMLFVAAGNWFSIPGLHIGAVETTTAHELAHQWFQGIVATHEVEWPMLDEGLTQWATGELLGHLYGRRRSAVDWLGFELDFFEVMRVFALRMDGPTAPPGSPAHAFGRDEYGRSVYGQTSVVLETVRRVWGAERFERAIGLYAREQRFRHPTPADLFGAFDRVYWPGFSARILEPALMEGATADLRMVALRNRREGDVWMSEVQAQRSGGLPVPTWIELQNAERERVRVPWPGDAPRLHTTHAGESRIVLARVDPDAHVLVDPAVLDDVQRQQPAEGGMFSRLLFLAQQLLGWAGP